MAGEPHDRPGAVAAAPATAGKNGPNNQNAKLCQQGGWEDLYTSTGAEFGSERECTGYAARGGTLLTAPPLAGQSACTDSQFRLTLVSRVPACAMRTSSSS